MLAGKLLGVVCMYQGAVGSLNNDLGPSMALRFDRLKIDSLPRANIFTQPAGSVGWHIIYL
jgi:hypothetical protein